MPIPVAKLKERTAPLSERLLDFLRKNPTQAYSETEIYGGVQGLDESALAVFILILLTGKSTGRLDEVRAALKELERDGLIQAAKHLNTTYYAIQQP
jgi:hypothetical protein